METKTKLKIGGGIIAFSVITALVNPQKSDRQSPTEISKTITETTVETTTEATTETTTETTTEQIQTTTEPVAPSGEAMDNFMASISSTLNSKYSGQYGISRDDEAVTINIWGHNPKSEDVIAYSDSLSDFDKYAHLRVNVLDKNDLNNVIASYYDRRLLFENKEYNFDKYDNINQQNTTDSYVLNTKSMIYHLPSCRMVSKISPENYSTSNLSDSELRSQNYSACGICLE